MIIIIIKKPALGREKRRDVSKELVVGVRLGYQSAGLRGQ